MVRFGGHRTSMHESVGTPNSQAPTTLLLLPHITHSGMEIGLESGGQAEPQSHVLPLIPHTAPIPKPLLARACKWVSSLTSPRCHTSRLHPSTAVYGVRIGLERAGQAGDHNASPPPHTLPATSIPRWNYTQVGPIPTSVPMA